MTTATVWTLTADDNDGITTTVHRSEAAAMITLRDRYSALDLPADDGDLVDYLTRSTWEGGPGVVVYIEAHDIEARGADQPAGAAPAPPADPSQAISDIRRLAGAADLAVSIVTISDVLMLKGHDGRAPTPAQRDAVVDAWEWRHFGENWSDWFEGLDLDTEG